VSGPAEGARPVLIVPARRLPVTTARRQGLVDVTAGVAGLAASSGLRDGVCSVYCPHTSCGLALTEAEDGLHQDLADVLEHLAPERRYWAHDDLSRRTANLVPGDRPNGHSHIRALLATLPQIDVPIVDGAAAFGRWQRLFLVELDGGRERELLVTCWGAT
jgi:secondary thiamine-phosphate synthase enzyme